MSNASLCTVSISQDDYRYYVKNITVLDSAVTSLGSDSLYYTLPEQFKLWDSSVKYWDQFENTSIPAKNPGGFRSNPHTGDYTNLYRYENPFPVPWDSAKYDDSIGLEFPKGFLKPTPPVVTYNVDPYQPTIELDIPPFDIPEITVPYLVLPDFSIKNYIRRRGLRTINVVVDGPCLTGSVSYASKSTIANITIGWDTPPPSGGTYALMTSNGQCYWQTVNLC